MTSKTERLVNYMIHVCVGVYPNGDYVVNMVDQEDLESNIKYNATWRPGRYYYVDGKYVCGGVLNTEVEEARIKEHLAMIAGLNITPTRFPTRPYK